MNRFKSSWLGLGLGVLLAGNAWAAPASAPHGLAVEHGQLLLDGKPFRIIAGDMHYTRVPREYWRPGNTTSAARTISPNSSAKRSRKACM
jgi:hypothetical protein